MTTKEKTITKSVQITPTEDYELNLIIARQGLKGGVATLIRKMLQEYIAKNQATC